MAHEQLNAIAEPMYWVSRAHEDTFGHDVVVKNDVAVSSRLYNGRILEGIKKIKNGQEPTPEFLDYIGHHYVSDVDSRVAVTEKLNDIEIAVSIADLFENGRENNIMNTLVDTVVDLCGLHGDQKQLHEEIYKVLPQFIKLRWDQYKEAGQGNLNIISWLSQYPATLMNVLQVHNYNTGKRQADPELLKEVNEQKEIWAKGVKQGVRQGWLDKSSIDRANHLDEAIVYEGDYFSTIFHETAGYYKSGKRDTVVAPNYLEWSTLHELNHALLEGMWGRESEVSPPVFINEAITEHIAQVMHNRTSLEDLKDDIKGPYIEEREILRELISWAPMFGISLQMADFTIAYSSVGDTRTKNWQKLNDKVSKMLGINNGLEKIQARIDTLENDPGFLLDEKGSKRHMICAEVTLAVIREKIQSQAKNIDDVSLAVA